MREHECDCGEAVDTAGARCARCLRLADLKRAWRESGLNLKLMATAEAILRDCLDRRGVKWEFEKIDPEVLYGELLPAWARIIASEAAR